MLNRWLTPPVFVDEEQTRLANLLHWMLIFLVVVNLVDAALLLVFAPETLPTFWMNGVFLALTLVAYRMMRAGRVRSGALLVCLSLWALLVGYLAISGGVTSPATGLFAVIIIVSAVMLGVQGALGFGFLCIASAAILYWFGSNGWLTSIEQTPTPARMFATQTAIFLILTLLMTVSGRTVWDALRRARADERALAERNHQLQQEIAQRERVQQSQERLVAIVEATSDMIAMSDLQGKLIHLNQGGRRLVGIGRDDDVTCTHITDYHPAAYGERIFSEAIPTALREGTWSGETMLRTRDGRELPVSQVVIAHKDAAGNCEFLSTIMRDISDRKQAEQQRLELAVEEERLASFKEFLSTISHDLKTPMTVILTGLELLERIEDPEHRKEKLAHIGQEMALLQTYIDDLLVLTRLDRLPDLTFVPLNVNRLLHDAETHVAPAAVEKGIVLRLRANAGLPAILGHERDIYRAMTNLIENAIHYTHAGGSVTVSARSDDSDVVIEVADTGIGIDPAEVDRVFERFYRSRQAQDMRSNGTGLGLAIVKRIIEVHAGAIEVESTPGVGTTFRIRLPLAQA
ncbi:MAG: ATP-binding protein [Anaerolineae bacterium]